MSGHFLNIPLTYNLGTRVAGYVPLRLSYALSTLIADISFLLYKPMVANVKHNLGQVFPGMSGTELTGMTRRLFRNYGKYIIDYGRFTYLKKEEALKKIMYFDGEENLEKALRMKKGIILVTAHLGNWELGGIFLSGYGIKMNVITLPDADERINEARARYRVRHNVGTITAGASPFSAVEMAMALNRNECVAMLIDRYSDNDAVTADFFNKPVKFPRGPFVLSRVTGAPVIAAFVVRERDGYRGVIEEPLVAGNAAEEVDTLNRTVKLLEKHIIRYPEQWYNFTPI